MAAPTFVDAGSTAGGTGASATSAALSFNGSATNDIVGEASNDYAIVALYKESTSAVGTPSGWTLLGQNDQDTGGFKYRTYVYGRRLDGTETTVTWSWSGSVWRYLECAVYRNAITSEAPVVTFVAEEETAQNTTPNHAAITIARSNSGLVWIVFNFSDITNTTAPTGYTHRVPDAPTSAARNILWYDDLSTTAGSSGTVSGTLGGDIEYPLTVLLELATEAAAGGAVTGTGALSIRKLTLAGTGTYTPLAITGTSAVLIRKPTLAANGTYTPLALTGTGALSIQKPTLVTSGAVASLNITGTGALTIRVAALDGDGWLLVSAITGTGTLVIAVPILAGSASVGTDGAGALVISGPSLAGIGISQIILPPPELEPFSGAPSIPLGVGPRGVAPSLAPHPSSSRAPAFSNEVRDVPTLSEYRRSVAIESGPYIGPESYNVRATSGSSTTVLVCSNYPIKSGIPQNDLLTERPLYRPDAVQEHDRHRYVQTYDPPTGTITPDLDWSIAPIAPPGGSSYEYLEAFTYSGLELMLYEDLEDLGLTGLGERFEVLGPFDVPTLHQLVNDGLKQCWMVVEVACVPTEGTSRHLLEDVVPWLQDANHVRQAGVLYAGADRNLSDPYENTVYGHIERDGGDFYFNTGSRTFNAGDVLYLRCYKRAYDHCRMAGGVFGDQSGLALETDEAPIERDWLASSALTVGWRRFGHLLEPVANQRLIRDQATAAAWFTDRSRQHFTAVAPQLTFRPARRFGPVFR